jgi:hypothetical protein
MSRILAETLPVSNPLEDSQDLSEEKLSVLKALADSLGTSLESLLSLFPYLLVLIGADHDSNPVDFNNQQADVKIGKCEAPAAPVQNTEDIEGVVDGEKPVVREPDGTLWTEADCPAIIAYINDIIQRLEDPELISLDKEELRRRLNFFLSAKVTLKCEGDYPLAEGDIE